MRPKLSYANVMSTRCACSSLLGGGAAYAASHLRQELGRHEATEKNAVTTAKIKKNAVTTAKIKNNAVTTAKIQRQRRQRDQNRCRIRWVRRSRRRLAARRQRDRRAVACEYAGVLAAPPQRNDLVHRARKQPVPVARVPASAPGRRNERRLL